MAILLKDVKMARWLHGHVKKSDHGTPFLPYALLYYLYILAQGILSPIPVFCARCILSSNP